MVARVLAVLLLTGCEPALLEAPGAMVVIPAGTFTMGCADAGCTPDEAPVHEVALDAFAIDVTEVTQEAYGMCVDAGVCTAPPYPECGWDPDEHAPYPVVCVSWHDATAFCAWAGKRLCTEAEWESAARGTDARIYPWGDDDPTCGHAVFADCGGVVEPVGSHPPGDSAHGVSDMAGNVWEWVADRYSADTYARADCCDNPRGPTDGSYRVSRGSAFFSPASYLRVTVRYWDFPSYVGDYLGIRCCRSE